MVELDVRPVRPEQATELVAGDDRLGMLKEVGEQHGGLRSQSRARASLSELSAVGVEDELAKPKDAHRLSTLSTSRALSRPSLDAARHRSRAPVPTTSSS